MLAFVTIVLSTLPTLTATSAKSTALTALEDKLAAATAQRKNAEASVANAEAGYTDALAKKQAIDQKIYALDIEIDAILALIEGYNAQITEKNNEIAAENARLEARYQLLRERIRAKHEDGNIDFLSVLLEADGLSQLFSEIDRFTAMMDYDARLLDSYKEGLDKLEVLRSALQADRAQLDMQMKELGARKSELEADLAAASKLVATAQNRLDSAEKDLMNVAAVELEYGNKREELLMELSRTTNEAFVGGEFLWPLSSKYTKVSSKYGWRIHPVTGKQQFHQGIDIPAPYGTEIMAVNDGTVVECSYNYADGYYITVSHGGGVASFYSHLSKYQVKVGDKVTRGQVIANVGTSGYTTGAHLNLNMYKNNSSVDPMEFFK